MVSLGEGEQPCAEQRVLRRDRRGRVLRAETHRAALALWAGAFDSQAVPRPSTWVLSRHIRRGSPRIECVFTLRSFWH